MAWTESTVNKTYNPSVFAVSSAAVAMANTAVSSDIIYRPLGGNKVMVGIEVTVAGADVEADVELYGSFDGTNWCALTTGLIADATPNVTGYKTAIVDLTNYRVAFYKIVFNETALNAGTTGRIKFVYGF